MASTEQQPQRVDIREMWPNEAYHFTPWLAENLDLLGAELSLELELEAQEKPVGPFRLDILARETGTDAKVAIENQLERSDFRHLAQLLVYATGCEARVAIWVATEFTYELAQVLHRLNEWTVDETQFYAVKVEVTRGVQDSELEPKFRKFVYPGGWDKGETLPLEPPPPPDVQRSQSIFEPLIAEVARTGQFQPKPRIRFDHAGRYAVSFEGTNNAWVILHIEAGDKESTKRTFDALDSRRSQIESEIPIDAESEWVWLRHDRWGFSSINVRRDGSITDPPEAQHEIRMWMLDLLKKFQEAFDPDVAA
ncbi:MAG: DUF4268 domain-containing protein, partial [Candidatus Aminicenantes bacterium]|nr:DUF4268 domain-containing protein [Candidatus Aminicenantes bacterium]